MELLDVGQHAEQFVGGEGLGQIIVGAELERSHGGFDGRKAGDDNDRTAAVARPGQFDQLKAVQVRQTQIGDHDLEGALFQSVDAGAAGFAGGHLITLLGQGFGEGDARYLFVFDEEYFHLAPPEGRVI